MIIGVKVKENNIIGLKTFSTKLRSLASQFKDKIDASIEMSKHLQADEAEKELNEIIDTINNIKLIFQKCYPFIQKEELNIIPNPYTPDKNPYIPKSPYPIIDPTCPDWSKMNQTWCDSNSYTAGGGGKLYDKDKENSGIKS